MVSGVLSPKASGEFIAKHAGDVSIDENGVKKLAEEIVKALKSKTLSIDGFSQHELHPQTVDEAAVQWIFVVDTLNFCFWTESQREKWEVTFHGKSYTGYFAWCAAVNRALEEGIAITDPNYFSKIRSKELKHILRSDNDGGSVSLVDERVQCLQQVGKVLLEKYEGTFVNCIKESKQSAQALLKLIVDNFSCFKDEAEYKGKKVSLYKRAQILIGDIWACFRGKGLGEFKDIDTIVMFADYRIPQVLVHYGAMKYSDDLMNKLKSDVLLENGSNEEVEIRGCSIEAVEQVKDTVLAMLKKENITDLLVNSVLIDHYLWDYRRKHADSLEVIPFHKTKSIYY
ncbi:queuosine 5'-phosphate N-glycosylase/hydrolase [Anabrus simplex]|uniref:queuosine 5'-phosphate N-glycosylase/hydrolase n=1 Tax=Anabrus simplex TaxID=316456 RepID=UPI0035A3CD5D